MDFGSSQHQKDIKKYIVSLLIKQAQIDGSFSSKEKQYLEYAGQSLQLDDHELAEIQADPNAFEISPPPDEQDRVKILYYLLFMMRIDHTITAKEEELCHRVGLRLGFRKGMIDNLIALMKEYLSDRLPPNAMIERIKPYLN